MPNGTLQAAEGTRSFSTKVTQVNPRSLGTVLEVRVSGECSGPVMGYRG